MAASRPASGSRVADPSDGRYALAEAGRKQVVDSAPGHVAQMRRLVSIR